MPTALTDTLRSLYTPAQLEAMDRVRSAMKADPAILDTHKKEKLVVNSETEDGK